MVTTKSKEQIDLLNELAVAERKVVAEKLNLSVDAIDQRIHRIRQKVRDARWFINNVQVIEQRFPHIKRMLLPTRADLVEEEGE